MAIDEKLFFARRLGFGLKAGEDLPMAPRDWAMEQIRSIPPLDFYGPDGSSIAAKLPKEAALITSWSEACKVWGEMDEVQVKFDSSPKKDINLEILLGFQYSHFPRWRDAMAVAMTAVNGPSPVFERFWHFWFNHFTVSTVESDGKVLQAAHLTALRNRMTGKFADMLYDAIANPAMLLYLDAVVSTGPHAPDHDDGATLNENLGRELLELHTVTPAQGYSQEDVVEAALVLTGWTFYPMNNRSRPRKPGLSFDPVRHEPGPRTILGKTYKPKGDGQNQLRDLIVDLAVHPATISHLSTKLARAFLSDDPPAESIDRIAKVFAETEGDLIAIHSAVIEEVLALGPQLPKLTTPMTWVLQAYKASGAPIPKNQPPTASIDIVFRELGQPYDQCLQPNGWSSLAKDWLSKALIDRRVRAAYIIADHVTDLKADALADYADRLMGADSPAALSVKRAESIQLAVATLLSSPQFLWI